MQVLFFTLFILQSIFLVDRNRIIIPKFLKTRLKIPTNNHCTKSRKLRIWSHLMKKSLMENFIFVRWIISALQWTLLFSFLIWHIQINGKKWNCENVYDFSNICRFCIHILPCSQKQPPKVFYKKNFLRNFAKFRGKHLY